MDVPTLLYNLKEEVTCSVCIHLYTNPKQLPCLHIFCLQCLNDLARTNSRHGKIKCPICETQVAVPESGTMETLPSCFYVKNLLDVLTIKECNTSKVTCGNCDKKSAEASYCFHCGRFWCKDCLNGHNILRENKEHRVLLLKDFEDRDFEDVFKQPVFCQKELHEKEVLKFYCKVCEIPLCQNCVIVEHNKHEVEYLEVCARRVKNNLASRLEAIKKSSQTVSDCIGDLEYMSHQLEKRSEIIKRQIRETAKSLTHSIKQQEEELLANLESETKALQTDYSTEKCKFQDHLKKSGELITQAERLLERCTGADLVRTKTAVDELLQGLPPMPSNTEDTHWKSAPVFAKNEEIFKCLHESKIGSLTTRKTETKANQCLVKGFSAELRSGLITEVEVVTRTSEGEQCYFPEDKISVELISTQDRNTAAEAKIFDNKDGSYIISFIPTEAGQYLPIIHINGETVGECKPLIIKERSFSPVRLIGKRFLGNNILEQPWGVTVSDSNEILVSDMGHDRVVVFNDKGQLIRFFGENFLKCPNGLIADNTGRVFVGNRRNSEILLFRENGEMIKKIYNGTSLNEPRGISLDPLGNILVCDSGNQRVKFISPDGKIFQVLGSCWNMPNNCLIHKNKIFVSDRDAHRIKVYSSRGQFLYQFGQYGVKDGDLNRPTGLAVDKTEHLLICSLGNHRVDVFTLGGKFVTKFGEKGKGLGQLVHPCSVSVLKSGHIVICEFGNNRLQVFE